MQHPIPVVLLALLSLFYMLGRSADLVVHNLRIIAEKLGIGVFFLGLIMGLFTSFPEMAIGINAIVDNVQNVSLGNLFGGIIVLLGLILGVNICLQRKIKAEQNLWQFGAIIVFLLIPVLLGLDGTLGVIEGLVIIIGYFSLVFAIYHRQRCTAGASRLSGKKGVAKHIFLFLLGLVLVLVLANFIVDLTVDVLSKLFLSKFAIGIIIFSLGTNIPEIIIAVRAWENRVGELSLSNLLGSGMGNMLLAGIFAVIQPFHLAIGSSYYILLVSLIVLLTLVFVFYKTDKALKRKEGILLILVYLLFVTLQVIFGVLV